YQLASRGDLPPEYVVVGFGRRDWSDDQFRDSWKESLAKEGGPSFGEAWPEFARHLAFVGGNIDDPEAFARLRGRLEELDASHGTQGNRLYYL
ncbi:hypothetical protein, partial [Acinetobacter baumannii]|uniref:hypothetical protein n=1 Tax=Acinetobacter baumannii TaxID=470 RepID=UPI003D6AE2EB